MGKKENLDLKLKVYFLEERMGVGIGGQTMKQLSDDNIELQIELQQCKTDLENKTSLIKEAVQAIDDCEKKIHYLEEQSDDLTGKVFTVETLEIGESVRNTASQTSMD